MAHGEIYSAEFFAREREGSSRSASLVVPVLMDALRPSSVVDVGCGIGTWAAEFARLGLRVVGVDGEYARTAGLLIDDSQLVGVDLEAAARARKMPASLGRFDLCVCLEVAEHLPAECSDGFVEVLTDLSDVVFFSAAVPHQGGTNHVNEQWQDYWVTKFAARGYSVSDAIQTRTWGNRAIGTWYRQNALTFFRPESATADVSARLRNTEAARPPESYARVHPEYFVACHLTALPSRVLAGELVRRVVRRLPLLGRSG